MYRRMRKKTKKEEEKRFSVKSQLIKKGTFTNQEEHINRRK